MEETKCYRAYVFGMFQTLTRCKRGARKCVRYCQLDMR